MKPLFEKLALPLALVAAVLLTARLAAAVAEYFMPPLPALECKAPSESVRGPFPFVRAFGLKNPPKKPASRPSRAPARPTVSLTGYELTMTAVGTPSMAMIRYNGKNKLLSVGERIDGFELVKVETDRVLLRKRGTDYWLAMNKKRGASGGASANRRAKKKSEGAYAEQIRKEGDTYYIPRELLKEMHDLRKIFKYIAIKPIYRNNKLIGFGISNVKKGSVFDKMGLRKRDIIQKIDGKPITDESEAFKYFNNLDEISSLRLTVKRGHVIKELHYEIF
ncbi:PDZ domain-containing protein [Hydrogenimonas sp.]